MTENKKNELATTKVALFEGKKIRKVFHQNEWWFSVIDVIEVLTDSTNPRRYWTDLKRKLKEEEGFFQLYDFLVQLKMQAPDGKMRETDTANTETMLRIIQSIPSPKAEPFKLWLAKVGYERIQEIENPELASQRGRALYKAKGYPPEWIEKRMRSIAIREELTSEWSRRNVKQGKEFGILTSEISKATFGMTPGDYKKYKSLKGKENLRDHMSDLELIFSMLGEASTKEITVKRDAQGFPENLQAARDGGAVAGNARRELEQKAGKRIISSENYLPKKKKELASEVNEEN